MKIDDRIGAKGFRLRNLDELIDLIGLCSPNQVLIGEDLVGHKESVLLKAGLPITKSAVRYLTENSKPGMKFVVQSSEELQSTIRREILQKAIGFIKSERFKAVSMCEEQYRKELWEAIALVLNQEEVAFLLFSLIRYEEEEGAYLFYHSISVAILTYAIARSMNSAFGTEEKAIQSIQAGFSHDLCLDDYLAKIGKGQTYLEEPEHQKDIGPYMKKWGFGSGVIQAVSNHHAYVKRGNYQEQVPEDCDKTLFHSLNTAECFTTLRDLVPGKREDEATYLLAHLGEEGSLEAQTIKVLGSLIQSREIISDVERLSEIEQLCTEYEAAHVYPKFLHSKPTQVVCRKEVVQCPKFLSSKAPLRILSDTSEGSLTKDMLSLAPGEYGKCALTEEIERYTGKKNPPEG